MIELTESDIDTIMRLARCKSSPEKKIRLLNDLNNILGQMEIIDRIDSHKIAADNNPIRKYPHKK